MAINPPVLDSQLLDNQARAKALGVDIPGVGVRPTAPALTVGSVYGNLGLGQYDSSPDAVINGALARAAAGAGDVPDADKVYQDKLKQYQGEINAVNRIYGEKLVESQTNGQNNLGSGRAIQARSGTLGSDFATSQNADITAKNTVADDLVRNEQYAKVQSILGLAKKDAADEVAARKTAQQQSTQDYITYLSQRTERQKANATKVAKALIDNEVDTTLVDPAHLAEIAKQYGIQASDIVSEYQTQKKALEDAKKKEEQQAIKDNSFNLSEGQSYYQYDPKTGGYKLIAEKAKTYAPKTPGASGLGPVGENGLSAVAAAVLANPGLLNNYTPTQKAAIQNELINAGVDTSALTLNDPSGGQRDNIAKYGDLERSANLAAKALSTATFGTGPIQGPLGAIKQSIKQGDPNYTDYSGAISNLSSILLNLRSGAAVSPSEAARLQGFIPAITDQEDVAAQKITNFIAEMKAAKQNYINTATQSTNTLVNGGTPPTTVRMSGPDGTFDVPQAQVATFTQNGYKTL